MKNRHKLYLFGFFWMFLVLMPVIVPFFLELGLSMAEIFKLQAVFGFSIVAFEVPTGYLCDLWGRKRAIILGSLLSAVSFSFLPFAGSFWELVGFEIVLALAASFVSGADISLLYENSENEGRARGRRSLANLQLSSVAGESVAALVGGALVAFSFGAVLLANAIAAWIPFFISLTLKEASYEKMSRESHWNNFKLVFSRIFRGHDPLLVLIFINLVIWGLSTFFAVWMFQKYWQEQSISLTYFGLLWAIYNLTVGIVGKQVHWIEAKLGTTPLLVFLGLAPILGYFGMGLTGGWLGVALGLLFYAARGVTQVLLKDALNWRIENTYRSTANSLQSFFFRLGFGIFGPLVGYCVDRFGTDKAMLILGSVFVAFFIVFLLPLIIKVRKLAPDSIPIV